MSCLVRRQETLASSQEFGVRRQDNKSTLFPVPCSLFPVPGSLTTDN
ncbi:hypothetical protein N44_00247 [Microcystis aeruginosa NIES-44]|uniref:Uncharacterized protein n=1 Tax=Microcystis aeruginosa NIES-44 TaxID=449439 RepID=A0A0A1VQU6_MICAE|nr:hypothetical protein N44_00247 [Microcystis aeruginosa NIES-44]